MRTSVDRWGALRARVKSEAHKLEASTAQPIPSAPVYARSVAESVDCRAVALAKADLFHLATSTQRATTRQANRIWDISYTFTSTKVRRIPSVSTSAGRWIFALDYAGTIQDKSHTQQSGNLGELRLTLHFQTLGEQGLSNDILNPPLAERLLRSDSSIFALRDSNSVDGGAHYAQGLKAKLTNWRRALRSQSLRRLRREIICGAGRSAG
jgi:hypothetical protein